MLGKHYKLKFLFLKKNNALHKNYSFQLLHHGTCRECSAVQTRITASSSKPLHKNTPLCKVAHHKLCEAVKNQRKLLKKIKKMLKAEHIELNDEMHQALSEVMANGWEKGDSFQKLFWQEQKRMQSQSPQGLLNSNFLLFNEACLFQQVIGGTRVW
jgi:hypothetical protein